MVRLAGVQPASRASAIVEALAVVPARFIADPLSPAQLVTLVTSCFLHAGWLHLGGNLLYLLVFGPAVEARLGRLRFAALYLAAGAAGALAHTLVNPDSTTPLVGASGAIAGLLGAHLVLEPRTQVTTLIPALVIFEVASLPAAFVIAVWFVGQAAAGLAPIAATADAETTAWFAHLGGFAAGCLLALPSAATDWWHRMRQRDARATRKGGKRAA